MWQRAMRDTKPLPGRVIPLPRPAPARAEPAPEPPAPQPAMVRQPPPEPPAPAVAVRRGRAPGLDRRTAERLRRGQLPIEARIDLHGLMQPAAEAALDAFITDAWAQRRRCLLVVTGKGQRSAGGTGVLRAAVPRWLAEGAGRARVLATAPAQPRDGGTGALYVLLRRRRDG